MKILADEGFNGIIIKELRQSGLALEWILENNSGITDYKVIEIAKNNKQILLTEDKDFGEWVFAHRITGLNIIFIRYQALDLSVITSNLISVLKNKSLTIL